MQLIQGALYRSRAGTVCRVEGRISMGLFMVRQLDTWHTYYVLVDGRFSTHEQSNVDLVKCLTPTGKLLLFPTDRQPAKFDEYWPGYCKHRKKEAARMERAMDNLVAIKKAKEWGEI